ncbi:MAG: shikimate dehydrogenase [Candidatus Andersenbacteria bacterium]
MKEHKISKDTQLCISISAKPSNFGTAVFNAAFRAQELDFVYKASRVEDEKGNLKRAIEGVRVLGIRGCGISMPFKQEAMRYVDTVDEFARKIGAINTIVNTNGALKGYNTDMFGALAVLRTVRGIQKKQVTLLGAGGVARAICAALAKLSVENVTIVNRQRKAGQALADTWDFEYATWKNLETISGNILINATPVGMPPKSNETPVSKKLLERYEALVDVVISPHPTKLVRQARTLDMRVIAGHQMSLYQAAKQFELYTRKKAPLAIMERAMNTMY